MINQQVVPCKYKTGKVLGQGTYATVKEAFHVETNKPYAVKIINKNLMRGHEQLVRNEIDVMRRVSQNHKNILSLVDCFETANNLYLVMDLASGGELFDRICNQGSFFEKDAAEIIVIVCNAVKYLHEHDIVHRDLKPENLIFQTPDDNATLLIADFGLSRIIDHDKFNALTTMCGTPGYMAPEILKKEGHGKPVDMWAIGVISYFLLCGYPPFDRDNHSEEMRAIISADYSFNDEFWDAISQDAKDFISVCLTLDASKRITAEEALNHPWLRVTDVKTQNLLPNVRRNFNARRTFKKAVDIVRVSQQLFNRHKLHHAGNIVTPVDEPIEHVLR